MEPPELLNLERSVGRMLVHTICPWNVLPAFLNLTTGRVNNRELLIANQGSEVGARDQFEQ